MINYLYYAIILYLIVTECYLMSMQTIYNARETSEILKVNEATVRRWVREGKIKSIQNIGKVRITEDELKRFIGE